MKAMRSPHWAWAAVNRGVSDRQGRHHEAQIFTTAGWSREASRARKEAGSVVGRSGRVVPEPAA
jgi:hypothetical protein